MSLIGDESPSCSICGQDDCIGFTHKLKPISLQPLRDLMVQRAHQNGELTQGKEAEEVVPKDFDGAARRNTPSRSARKAADRARKLAHDRAIHPEEDR